MRRTFSRAWPSLLWSRWYCSRRSKGPSLRRGRCITGARRPPSVRAAIFLNGAPDSPDLLRYIARRADLIVAADGGARYALGAGIIPDLVVGDMDSLGEDLAREVER